MEPLRSNIDYFQQECDLHFAVERCNDGADRSALVYCRQELNVCIAWTVAIHLSDPALYEAHLLYHFKRACEVIDDDFVFRSVQDTGFINFRREKSAARTVSGAVMHLSMVCPRMGGGTE